MDKYEIFEKNLMDSIEEGDEREKAQMYSAGSIGLIAMAIAIMGFYFFNFFIGRETGDLMAIFFIGTSTASLFFYVATKKRESLIATVVFFLSALIFTITYVIRVLG